MKPDKTAGWTSPILLIVSIALILGISAASLRRLLGLGQRVPPPSASPVVLPPHPGRLLIILIDSARHDFMFSDAMPFIHGARERGAWGISRAVTIPLTVVCEEAMFTGQRSGPMAIFSNFMGDPTAYESIFERLSKAGKRVVITGNKACLYGLFSRWTVDPASGKGPGKAVRWGQYDLVAQHGFETAYRDLTETRWDVAAVQLLAVDAVGHLKTPKSPNYRSVCSTVDGHVRELAGLMTDADYVLITAEHGMSENGFHTDQSPDNVETAYVFWGPGIKRNREVDLLQIDWVSTLSLAAGVSPFYESLSVPALDMFEMTRAEQDRWLREFSLRITGRPDAESLHELRRIRDDRLVADRSLPYFAMSFILGVLAVSTLLIIAHPGPNEAIQGRFLAGALAGGVAMLAIPGLYSLSGLEKAIQNSLPFSAKFLMQHSLWIIFLLAVIERMSARGSRSRIAVRLAASPGFSVPVLLLGLLGAVFASEQPYFALNWVLLLTPVVAWGITRRSEWVLILGSFVLGLLVRRLTYYTLQGYFTLPGRPVLTLGIAIAVTALASWRSFRRRSGLHLGPYGFSTVAMSVACVFLTHTIAGRAIGLVASLTPLALESILKRRFDRLGWATWSVLFILGTSGDVNQTTGVAFLPLALALWGCATRHSPVATGFAACQAVWMLFVLPGNEINARIPELADPFIVGNILETNMAETVAIVSSRYVIPYSVLLFGILSAGRAFLPSISAMLLPVATALAAKMALMSIQRYDIISSTQNELIVNYMIYLSVFAILAVVIHAADAIILRCRQGGVDPRG